MKTGATVLGFVLLLGAVGLPYFPGIVHLFVTAVIDTEPPLMISIIFYVPDYPNHTDYYGLTFGTRDSPNPLPPPGTAGKLRITFLEKNPDIGTILITGPSYNSGEQTLIIQTGDYDIHRALYAWTVPAQSGTYTFQVKLTDKSGNQTIETYYGATTSAKGYFTINGQKITSVDQTLHLNTRSLAFKFYATEGGSLIKEVEVTIKDSTGFPLAELELTEIVADREWEGSYTFANDGTYIIEGEILVGSSQYIRLMSLTTQIGFVLDNLALARIILGVLGIISLAYGVYPRREEG